MIATPLSAHETRLETILAAAKRYGATSAEAGINTETGFSVEVRDQQVDTLEYHSGQGVELTVFCGQKTASVGGSDLSDASLDALAAAP